MKTCTSCKTVKLLSDFGTDRGTVDGLTCRCRACLNTTAKAYRKRHPRKDKRHTPEYHRKWHLESKYGKGAVEKRDALLAAQGGTCAICRCRPDYRLYVDHDHTKEHPDGTVPWSAVRGLLCHPCNTALGMLKDSTTLLRLAAEYLETRHA